jgi:hypothetical protein
VNVYGEFFFEVECRSQIYVCTFEVECRSQVYECTFEVECRSQVYECTFEVECRSPYICTFEESLLRWAPTQERIKGRTIAYKSILT